jgi:hypothetical protein
MTYTTILSNSDVIALANGMEEGDVTAFTVTAEVVAHEFALVRAVIHHGWSVRQEDDEFVFSDPGGIERGRIYDVRSRPEP